MKNHEWNNGRLLQTNKKWSQLKEQQKNRIMEIAKKEYDQFIETRGKLPVHGSKKQLIEAIYDRIDALDIWIPFGEVSRVLSARIERWNRTGSNEKNSEKTQSDSHDIEVSPKD